MTWTWSPFPVQLVGPGGTYRFTRKAVSRADVRRAYRGEIPLLEQTLLNKDPSETGRMDDLRRGRVGLRGDDDEIEDPVTGVKGNLVRLDSEDGKRRILLMSWRDDPS